MNDDFLYKRQESPAPEFVAELREKLHQVEEPQKAKRKKGQRYVNWKAIAAVFVFFIVVAGIFIYTPEIHIPVTDFILGYPNEEVLENAQETFGFELPELPYGYYIALIQHTNLDAPHVFVHWQTYRGFCVISLFAFPDPQSPEAIQQNQEYNRHLAESFSWADIVELGNGIEGIWRSTTYNGAPLEVSLEWYLGDNRYELSSTVECATKEILATIAQSTLPDNP